MTIEEFCNMFQNSEVVVVFDKDTSITYEERNGDRIPIVHGNFHFEIRDKRGDK